MKSREARTGVAPPREKPKGARDWMWAAPLVALVIAAYQPVWFAGYIWDDDKLLTLNPVIVGPLGFKEIWTTKAADICPLTISTFWIEDKAWGLSPLPYHLVNVLLQALCAVMLWRALAALRIPGAWLGAALWAIHPVQVESVAWVSELKNMESGAFYLLAVLFFVRHLKEKSATRSLHWQGTYILALLFAALAMMSKVSAAVLPFVLVLCIWWMDGQLRLRTLLKITPVFLMSIGAMALATWNAANQWIPSDAKWNLTFPERVIVAGQVLWFYLEKLAWPYPLFMTYPRWQIDAASPLSYVPLLTAIGALAVSWFYRQRWTRGPFFALAYFVVALLPVLGFANHYYMRYSFVADHFQYLASIGPLTLVSAGLTRLATTLLPQKKALRTGLAAAMLLILATGSWRQSWVYQNEETLWTHTLRWNPLCWEAYNNLGIVESRRGQVEKAVANYEKALTIQPDFPEAHNNLGKAFLREGRADDAITEFQKSLALSPKALAELGLADALVLKSQSDEALSHFQRAIDLNPDYADAYFNYGTLLASKNKNDRAISCFQKVVALSPCDAQAHHSLGVALMKQGRLDAAISEFQTALRWTPDFQEARDHLIEAEKLKSIESSSK